MSSNYQSVLVTDRRTGSEVNLFSRDAGAKDAPVILLLHGFPSSSHQYRGLIERLSGKHRVIAPDLPGFGFSDAPEASSFGYTFAHLAEVVESFTDALRLTRYALYVFDYGACGVSSRRLSSRMYCRHHFPEWQCIRRRSERRLEPNSRLLGSKSNVAAYPKFHEYFRAHQPNLLAVWGKNDPFFLPAGAEAYRRDLPDAEIHFLDAGHFAL